MDVGSKWTVSALLGIAWRDFLLLSSFLLLSLLSMVLATMMMTQMRIVLGHSQSDFGADPRTLQ
jgi:hypothetical protein